MTTTARTAAPLLVAALAAAVALAPAGCSHNPGYFPYLLPGGPINQSHAKPGGRGYFRDFDPKAVRLDVTPSELVTAPVGTQVVLVGTVRDAEGQPRRSRRVEWLLDGPGYIVEADESGVFPGRGYKVDNKYAVTYTNYLKKTITRGNQDGGDDVCIAPGQTFCVVSSAVPGETVVTAYAPEVYNWDNGRVVVKIQWGDGRFKFPEPAVVRYGGEHTLTTVISTASADEVPSGYRVRYKVLDGAAVLVSQSGSGTGASQSGTEGKEAEAFTDANGEAAVQLVQRTPKPGKTRVAIEVLQPPVNGAGPGAVVGRRETVIEWAAPEVKLGVEAPPAAAPNGTFPVAVTLDNESGVASGDAKVSVRLSDGATLARSDPPPTRQDANGTLTFELSAVPGQGSQRVLLDVKPAKLGPVTVSVDALTADGLSATKQATTRVEQGKIEVKVEHPPAAVTGEQVPFKVTVANLGPVRAENATVWARFDGGLKFATPHNPVELAAGTLVPGQTKTLDLPLTAERAGRFAVRATVTADSGLTATADAATIEVQRTDLTVTATGPRLAYLDQDFEWAVTVKNPGDVTVSNVVVRARVPDEAWVKSPGGGKATPGQIEWTRAELRPNEEATFRITANAAKLAAKATLNTTATGEVVRDAKRVGKPFEVRAESAVPIIGTPAVALELATPPGVVDVGKRVTYQVRVRNRGNVPARSVQVTAYAPPELRPVRGSGSLRSDRGPQGGSTQATIDGTGRVALPLIDELRPGETLLVTIDADTVKAGNARFRAEVRAAHLTQALKEEQSTRVTPR